MKTVFIVNPKAGKKKDKERFISHIVSSVSELRTDAEVYITKARGDATDFVRKFCKERGAARFIACGGDGTLSEVLNGAMETGGCEIGVLPAGTGNDFCRNFDKNCVFDSIKLQAEGPSRKCDAIKYTIFTGDGIKKGYCANMFNIGFDCSVADMTSDIKEKTFIWGSFAYFVSILINLVRKKCSVLRIEADGEVLHDGQLLLTSVANGCYCGGGIMSNPMASLNDGYINFNIIKNVSRTRFISLLPGYMKGSFLKIKGIERFVKSEKCKKITVTPCQENMRLCVDGEIIDAGKTEFEIVHNAFDFVLPCEKSSHLCVEPDVSK